MAAQQTRSLGAFVSTVSATSERRFYRDTDRACLGGVCAGVAEYLGFNLKVTRILTVVAFLMMGPVVLLAYVAAVFLIPATPGGRPVGAAAKRAFRCHRSKRRERRRRREERSFEAEDSVPSAAVRREIVREKCRELEVRLARLEKHVTSRKFQIDQELRRL